MLCRYLTVSKTEKQVVTLLQSVRAATAKSERISFFACVLGLKPPSVMPLGLTFYLASWQGAWGGGGGGHGGCCGPTSALLPAAP